MTLKTKLLKNQIKAVEKLQQIKIGALYMKMGKGKTRTALELIKLRFEVGKIDNVLWLCPCSVKENLKRDIKKHVESGTEIIQIYGIESLSQSDRLYLKLLDIATNTKTYLVVDESNLVKNHFAKRTERIYQLSLSCPYRLILNGTPVSKNEADLFAQWYILDKRILGYNSFWSFAANHLEYDEYGKPRRCLNVDYLTRKIAPYSYIGDDKDDEILPPKRYHTYYYDLSYEQQIYYYDAKELLLSNVNDFDSTTIYKLFTGLQQITSGNRLTQINPLKSVPIFQDPLNNPRIQTLLDVIPGENEKVIIWCKFKQEINDITEVLRHQYGNKSVALFYGDIKLRDRQRELDKFEQEAIFLLANKVCGGYGLNLQFCRNMIYYSNDFNWATRAQSEDRVHRIGQLHDVDIADICAKSKIDERILSNLYKKENLSDSFKRELKNNREGLSNWLDGKD